MHFCTLSLALLVPLAAQLAYGQSRTVFLTDERCYLEFEQRLNQRMNFEFFETPLSDFVEYLSTASQIPCQFNAAALDLVGLGSDTPITGRYRGARVRDALRLILDEHELTWTFQNQLLLITTPEAAEQDLITRVYDARRVVTAGWVRDYWSPRVNAGDKQIYVYDFGSLIELITITIAPTTWDVVGGPGSITGHAGQLGPALVVSQTYEVHEQIDRLLSKLELFAGTSVSPPPTKRRIVARSGQFRSQPGNSAQWTTSSIRSSQLRTTGQ